LAEEKSQSQTDSLIKPFIFINLRHFNYTLFQEEVKDWLSRDQTNPLSGLPIQSDVRLQTPN